jgi:serine/threonine protein kinase
MAPPTAEKVAQRAFDLGLLDERQLRQVWAELGSRDATSDELLGVLLRREFLTNYQVERLMKGDRQGFFFGPYRVLYLMGAGSFARVYRAVHQETGQVVALKVLRNRYSDNPVQFGQFVREGQLGCALRHPNIVPTYEVVSEGRSHFLVMEFVEGWNLREFVNIRKQLDPTEAVRVMIGITEGMKYAFERGLTHRDLKMNNVLISSGGVAKLVDFGLAALDETMGDELASDLPNTRTVDYAALERVTGVRKDDTRSDIYFLGCILYNMLTGQPPLSETRDRMQRLSKSRFLGVTPIKKIAPDLAPAVTIVVNKAMMLDPHRRYQTPAAMLTDLNLATERLKEDPEQAGRVTNKPSAASPKKQPARPRRSVMVVESNTGMQDVFREGLKRAGYRVLVLSDPDRALARFHQDSTAADCLLLNAKQFGHRAVEMFNRLGEIGRTDFIPIVLLLGEKQLDWMDEVVTNDHRVVLQMPFTMKKLRSVLAKVLIPNKAP